MENTQDSQMIEDIRQSPAWAEYLQTLGWKCIKTSQNINVEAMNTPFGAIVKVQRPKILAASDLKEIEELLEKNCKKPPLFIKIEPGLNQNLDVLKEAKYQKSTAPLCPPTTIYINLTQTKEQLWGKISKSGKYSIKRAQREGTTVKFYKNPSTEQLKKFYQMFKQTGKTKNFYIQSFADLQAKAEIFRDNVFLIEAYNKTEQLVGANFYLGHKNNVWFMHGGTTPLGRTGKGGYELVWQAFLYFKELGYHILDLEGKDDDRFPAFTKNWGGFSYFKEKFGGDIVEFPRPYVKYVSKFLKKMVKISNLSL